jgi:DNA (cytosine-5)-methyltransferase 1
MLKVLDLFSGIGGFSLGLERTGGFETVAFCEIEEYPRKVLAKHWPDVPCHNDVRELTADAVGHIDLICGGYPCQPFSHAGQRRGSEDNRHLWPEVKRLVASIRPRWCLFENVAGHISMGLDEVLSDLESEGYTCWPVVIPACAVDAPHRRDRVWVLASNSECLPSPEQEREYQGAKECRGSGGDGLVAGETLANRESDGREQREQDARGRGEGTGPREEQGFGDGGGAVVNANGAGLQVSGQAGRQESKKEKGTREKSGLERCSRWLPEPGVGRVAHGVPKRVDRLKALGNSVVPQIPEMIGRAILEAEKSQ